MDHAQSMFNVIKTKFLGAGEMVQQLRALAALPEVQFPATT